MSLNAVSTDYTSAQVDRSIRVGSALPSTSRVGEIYFLVGSTKKLYACFTANTWTEIEAAASSGTQVYNESPTGTVDGLNATFTLAHPPVAGSLQLYLNGRYLVPTVDYTIAAAVLTMDDGSIPYGLDVLIATYLY